MLVHHDVADRLAPARRQAAGLAVVEAEAFFQRDPSDPGFDARHRVAQVRAARQHDVVGVARIARAEGVSQAVEPQVQAKRAQVGQHGRGRRALRQVRVAQVLELRPGEAAVFMQAP